MVWCDSPIGWIGLVRSEDPDRRADRRDVVRPDPLDRLVAHPDTSVRNRIRRNERVTVDREPRVKNLGRQSWPSESMTRPSTSR